MTKEGPAIYRAEAEPWEHKLEKTRRVSEYVIAPATVLSLLLGGFNTTCYQVEKLKKDQQVSEWESLSRIAEENENYTDALRSIEKAEDAKPEDQEIRFSALRCKCKLALYEGKGQADLIPEIAEFIAASPTHGCEARVWLAKMSHSLGDFEGALRELTKIPPGKLKGKLEVDRFYYLASARTKLGDKKGIEDAAAGLRLAKEGNDIVGQAQILNALGSGFRATGEFEQAIRQYDLAFGVTEGSRVTPVLLRVRFAALDGKASTLSAMERFDDAKREFAAALGIAREIGDRGLISSVENSKGNIAMREGDFEAAMGLYTTALEGYMQSSRNRHPVLVGLSHCQLHLGDLESAREFRWRASAHYRQEVTAHRINQIALEAELAYFEGNLTEWKRLGEEFSRYAIEIAQVRGAFDHFCDTTEFNSGGTTTSPSVE